MAFPYRRFYGKGSRTTSPPVFRMRSSKSGCGRQQEDRDVLKDLGIGE